MGYKMFEKQPAFFPSVSAEIFFETEDALKSGELKLDASEADLSAELDAILALSDDAKKSDEHSAAR
ncbi:hypothetical protein ATO8_01515 [Roseivivax marinus]|uniref:Uncharacterized protein n=1 Tax=Roseivivax marinus TaxID=1379903 RepID=W4HR12_9RHOB|nr:hypothetical protein [Roseivivax marinus]ETW14546.1 hypothetical protein ATO8_01515 [Roseivivax marinus]